MRNGFWKNIFKQYRTLDDLLNTVKYTYRVLYYKNKIGYIFKIT